MESILVMAVSRGQNNGYLCQVATETFTPILGIRRIDSKESICGNSLPRN